MGCFATRPSGRCRFPNLYNVKTDRPPPTAWSNRPHIVSDMQLHGFIRHKSIMIVCRQAYWPLQHMNGLWAFVAMVAAADNPPLSYQECRPRCVSRTSNEVHLILAFFTTTGRSCVKLVFRLVISLVLPSTLEKAKYVPALTLP